MGSIMIGSGTTMARIRQSTSGPHMRKERQLGPRRLETAFLEPFERTHQMLQLDPRQRTYLAAALLGRDVATAWTGGMLHQGPPADDTAADVRARRVGVGIVRVAGLPWSRASHCLFPPAARAQAVSYSCL